MTQTPTSKTCDYQVAEWNEEYRTCDKKATKVALPEGEPAFHYCKKHFDKAEPFLTSRLVPVSDV